MPSEDPFRALADSAPALIWTTDAEGLVTFVNAEWLRFTGRTLAEELGSTWALGVHPDDERDLLTTWDEVLAARGHWEREYRLRRADGEYRWIAERGEPFYEAGEFVGYVGTAIDIHERKLLERRLRGAVEREHRIAETLQRSLLPERLPEIEGLALAARYLPASRGAAVGGDWYDALELKDGRVALVVGDVAGHGLRAAADMGQLRTAFRAYGLVQDSPAEVMARINRLVMSGGENTMATVLYVVLDRETGQVTFTCAGHPPPLVVGPGGARFLEGGRSLPVGAADPAAFHEGTGRVEPGATLLLYTDGLVELRDVDLADRLAQLGAAAAAGPADDLDRLCDRVLDSVLGTREPVDDVALLAVRPQVVRTDRLELTLAAAPESLGGLRRRLERFLHAGGATREEAFELELCVCEAAANAIEHAYGPEDARFDVEVRMEGSDVIATVLDTGSWRERRVGEGGRGLKIIEGLMDDVRLAREEAGTVVQMRRRLRQARPSGRWR